MTDKQRMEDFNRGVVEGMKHQSPSPQTIEEINELKEEWAEFKAMARNIFIAGAVCYFSYGVWVGIIQTRQIRNIDDVALNTRQIETLSNRINAVEVNNGEVKAKLTNIEVTLQEIKAAVKGIR
jgi:hypothetical protein